MKPFLRNQLERFAQRLEELDFLLSREDIMGDMQKYRSISREHADVTAVAGRYQRYLQTEADIAAAREMLADPDMAEMAQDEISAGEAALVQLEDELQRLLLPKDPDDARPAFVEIRAGTGGDEAAMNASLALLGELKLTSPDGSPVLSLARVEQLGYDRFDAVYVPGGHAPMQDLLTSLELGRLLTDFHAKGKTTALVCHGPIALLSTLPDAPAFVRSLEAGAAASQAGWIYAGYQLTVISNQEEEIAKALLDGGTMKFYPQTALEAAGARHLSNQTPFSPNVVIDRELITGQNPASAPAVAQALIERLD